jgi:hypothetical protein
MGGIIGVVESQSLQIVDNYWDGCQHAALSGQLGVGFLWW